MVAVGGDIDDGLMKFAASSTVTGLEARPTGAMRRGSGEAVMVSEGRRVAVEGWGVRVYRGRGVGEQGEGGKDGCGEEGMAACHWMRDPGEES
ncbi:hypothetical protein E2C01_019782 [Portunus trituberculatus]|uniref:Uncharacterized protein n=1 Tax=Portunus trituberculatus TaxID=210409 RepID=A0A5B7E0B6_PORTR|nr:hypothetical protein [Portunus trituberculatus]